MPEAVLPRKLKLFSVTNIVIGDMIGAGIFTTSGLLMVQLHDPRLLLLLWLVGGAIALSGALSYGELGARFPNAGGDYAFLTRLFSPPLNRPSLSPTGPIFAWATLIFGAGGKLTPSLKNGLAATDNVAGFLSACSKCPRTSSDRQ